MNPLNLSLVIVGVLLIAIGAGASTGLIPISITNSPASTCAAANYYGTAVSQMPLNGASYPLCFTYTAGLSTTGSIQVYVHGYAEPSWNLNGSYFLDLYPNVKTATVPLSMNTIPNGPFQGNVTTFQGWGNVSGALWNCATVNVAIGITATGAANTQFSGGAKVVAQTPFTLYVGSVTSSCTSGGSSNPGGSSSGGIPGPSCSSVPNPNTGTTTTTCGSGWATSGFTVTVTGLLAQFHDGTITTGKVAGVTWLFGDGTTGNGLYSNHTYKSSGTYKATEIATINSSGNFQISASLNVTVNGTGTTPTMTTTTPIPTGSHAPPISPIGGGFILAGVLLAFAQVVPVVNRTPWLMAVFVAAGAVGGYLLGTIV